jgi:hypothetical protein
MDISAEAYSDSLFRSSDAPAWEKTSANSMPVSGGGTFFGRPGSQRESAFQKKLELLRESLSPSCVSFFGKRKTPTREARSRWVKKNDLLTNQAEVRLGAYSSM